MRNLANVTASVHIQAILKDAEETETVDELASAASRSMRKKLTQSGIVSIRTRVFPQRRI